jgi:N-acetylglucosaminyl-diphospho-decaprenol L-rhamnosyltransferase
VTEVGEVDAVVVNYNSGAWLTTCVEGLLAEKVASVVVVDNGSTDDSLRRLDESGLATTVIRAPRNLGYGGGANLGVAASRSQYVLVCNPDLTLSQGALKACCRRLDGDGSIGIVGPMLRDLDGHVYPSGRDFPTIGDSLGHGFLGLFWGGNPWTRRYRRIGADQHVTRAADWVSGACFVARRVAFDSVGGFDEGYFMYVEDVDLCWRLRRAGWEVWYEPGAEAVHEQGTSTSLAPYRMLVAHHRSLMRFARRSASGNDRLLLPLVGVGLVLRLLLAWADHLLRPVRERVAPTAKVRHRARGELQS